jgi:hypothetical protein
MTITAAPRAHLHTASRHPRRLAAALAVFALAATAVVTTYAPANAADASAQTVTESVYFDAAKAVLTDTAQATLDVFLLEVPSDATNVSTKVIGWVQETRSKANDMRLSTARARNVANYLQAQGLSGDISIQGRGIKNRTILARTASVSITYTPAVPPAPVVVGPTVPCRIPSSSVTPFGTVINVSFILGCDGGSPITSVQYNRDGTWITVPPNAPFSMPEPVPGTTKSFKIRAVNAVGPGPAWEVPTPAGVITCVDPVITGEGGVWINSNWTETGIEFTAEPGQWSENATFTYQWYLGDVNYGGTPIEGATGSTLIRPNWNTVSVVITAHSGSCSATASDVYYD